MSNEDFDWANKIQNLKNNLPHRVKSLDCIRRIDCIKEWASDIEKCVNGPIDKASWDIVGRAAIILNNDREQTKDLLFLIAQLSKINFIALNSDEFARALDQYHSLLNNAPCILYLEPSEWMKKIDKDNLKKNKTN